MKLLRELLNHINDYKHTNMLLEELSLALEHQTYKSIPGTTSSFRQDSANTCSNTQKHAHVYAKRNGGGKELYSVNMDGSGHDGYSGTAIPSSHAKYFKGLGYKIADTFILESLNYSSIILDDFAFCIFYEDA